MQAKDLLMQMDLSGDAAHDAFILNYCARSEPNPDGSELINFTGAINGCPCTIEQQLIDYCTRIPEFKQVVMQVAHRFGMGMVFGLVIGGGVSAPSLHVDEQGNLKTGGDENK